MFYRMYLLQFLHFVDIHISALFLIENNKNIKFWGKCIAVLCFIKFKCQIFTGLRSLLGPALFSMVFKPTVYSNFIAGEAQVLPTKRCRLSWLTNSALIYESQCGGEGGGCGVSANEYSCAHHVTWSPNKLRGSTHVSPYLTYVPTGTLLPSSQPIGDRIRPPIGLVGPYYLPVFRHIIQSRLSLCLSQLQVASIFSR